MKGGCLGMDGKGEGASLALRAATSAAASHSSERS